MSIRAAALLWIRSLPAVTAIVGAGDAARVFPYAAPEDVEGTATAFIVYRRADNPDGRQLAAQGNIHFAELEFACCARSAVVAENLATALGNGVQAANRTTYPNGVTISSATHTGEVDGFYDLADGSSAVGYLTTVTIRFAYKAGG